MNERDLSFQDVDNPNPEARTVVSGHFVRAQRVRTHDWAMAIGGN